jgi:hypothetical protein
MIRTFMFKTFTSIESTRLEEKRMSGKKNIYKGQVSYGNIEWCFLNFIDPVNIFNKNKRRIDTKISSDFLWKSIQRIEFSEIQVI